MMLAMSIFLSTSAILNGVTDRISIIASSTGAVGWTAKAVAVISTKAIAVVLPWLLLRQLFLLLSPLGLSLQCR